MRARLTEGSCGRNVWWLIHPTSKQAIAAFEDPFTGAIRELSLPQCMDVWGDLAGGDDATVKAPPSRASTLNEEALRSISIPRSNTNAASNDPNEDSAQFRTVQVKGQTIKLPRVPRKFQAFAKTRRLIHREISNMSGLAFHSNVLQLHAALELVQDTKCTTFLVLELATGGELFDRIKLDAGTDEQSARRYFAQLVSGVAFCHHSGVCHRDLKPENLLLADADEPSVLKIADFGLSAIFASCADGDLSDHGAQASALALSSIRRLTSVVGSPHYVAPEVLMDAGGTGYDGAKADAWSIGVILYAMLVGNLPFGKDLLTCARYDKFRKWAYRTKYSDPIEDDDGGGNFRGSHHNTMNSISPDGQIPGNVSGNGNGNSDDPAADELANKSGDDVFPSWFYPARFTFEVKSLLSQLLYPDPGMRLSVDEARHHAWVVGKKIRRKNNLSPNAERDAVAKTANADSSDNAGSRQRCFDHREEPVVFEMDIAPTPTEAATRTDANKANSTPSSFASRMNLAVDVPPFNPILNTRPILGNTPTKNAALDVEQLRSAHRVDSSPSASGFMYSKNNLLPPRHSPVASGIAISPNYGHHHLLRSPHPTVIMQSVDETAPLASPPKEPAQKDEGFPTKASQNVDGPAKGEKLIDEVVASPPTEASLSSTLTPAASVETTLPTTEVSPPTSKPLASTTSQHLHRFVSPPLATALTHSASIYSQPLSSQTPSVTSPTIASATAAASSASSSRYQRFRHPQQRRNSPPEIFIRGFDRVCIKFEELPALDTLPPSSYDAVASAAPTSTSVTTTPSSQVDQIAPTASAAPSTSPPSYRDLVSRSTRFLTTAPAPVVLARLETILNTDISNDLSGDRVVVDWEKFQLQLWRGGGTRLECTVQVFLYQRGVYLVEFRRGQVRVILLCCHCHHAQNVVLLFRLTYSSLSAFTKMCEPSCPSQSTTVTRTVVAAPAEHSCHYADATSPSRATSTNRYSTLIYLTCACSLILHREEALFSLSASTP